MIRASSSLAIALLFAAGGLRAQTWDGGGTNSNWNTKNNWNPNTTPAFNNSTDLIFAGSTRLTPDLNGNRTVNSITFASGASGFTLLGDNGPNSETLTFNGSGAALTQSSANDQSLVMNRIRFSAATTIDTGGAGTLFLGDGTATAGRLYGNSDITKTGTGGTLVLAADNSNWSGDLALDAGIVEARHSSALGGTSGTTTVASGAALHLAAGGLTIAENLTLTGSGSSGTGALRNVATTGTNTVSSTVALAGLTRIEADAGGTLALAGGITATNQNVTLGGAGTLLLSGALATGAGTLTKEGAGTLRLAATNTFTGTTVISAGTIIAEAAAVFSATANLTVSTGASLALNNTAQTIGSLGGDGTVDFGTSGSLTLASGSATFSGSFAGSGTIIIGPGATLVLGTDFSAPNLNLILAGGTLNLNGTTSTFGNLELTGSSVLDFGSSTASTLTVNNLTFQNSGLQLSVQNWADLTDYFYAQNFPGATPDLRGSLPTTQVVFSGYTGNDTGWLSYDTQVTPVPEPRVYGALLLLGAAGLVAWRRRAKLRA